LRNKIADHNIKGVTPEAIRPFRAYSWPGNVRELRNVIEWVVVLEDGDMISTRYLLRYLVPTAENSLYHGSSVIDADAMVRLPREGISLDAVEKSLLKQALLSADGNQTQAANLLGLTRDQFRYRLKKLRQTVPGEAESGRRDEAPGHCV